MSLTEDQERAATQIAAILRPLRVLPLYEEDTRGCASAQLDVVREVLRRLDVDGLGGCRLCAN